MSTGALKGEREVAGLRCGQVLAGLTEYLAGGLDTATRERVEQHVRGCTHCERFGGEFGHAIRAIRGSAVAPPIEVLARLEARLASK
ncbi:MAG: zf-HC2 domain-containing protein [Sandaracinus sp.]|jgi:anti-sigma factor RsiW